MYVDIMSEFMPSMTRDGRGDELLLDLDRVHHHRLGTPSSTRFSADRSVQCMRTANSVCIASSRLMSSLEKHSQGGRRALEL
jgi:hypothetical protein